MTKSNKNPTIEKVIDKPKRKRKKYIKVKIRNRLK